MSNMIMQVMVGSRLEVLNSSGELSMKRRHAFIRRAATFRREAGYWFYARASGDVRCWCWQLETWHGLGPTVCVRAWLHGRNL